VQMNDYTLGEAVVEMERKMRGIEKRESSKEGEVKVERGWLCRQGGGGNGPAELRGSR
jgi:hypothetical protein